MFILILHKMFMQSFYLMTAANERSIALKKVSNNEL